MLGKYNDVYRIAYEVEGGEYLLNPKATYVYLERLNEINNSERDKNFELTTFNQTSLIFKIDCTLENHHFFKSKFIILDSTQNQMVINKFSASKYLQEIESINNSSTLERGETPEADIRP